MIQLFSMDKGIRTTQYLPLTGVQESHVRASALLLIREGIDLSIIYIYAGAVAARHPGLRCPLPKLRLAAGLLKVRARAGLLTEGESIQRGAPSGQ